MREYPLAAAIKGRLSRAARALHSVDPVPFVGGMLDRSFSLPMGSPEYGHNTLTPGTVPFEPSFSEHEPGALRFGIEPLVGASPITRRQEATREVRRLVAPVFGSEALRWFDERSEEWRGNRIDGRSSYGAWFGAAFDDRGLAATKIYYELQPGQAGYLPGRAGGLTRVALESLPGLWPIFTSIRCGRQSGSQRVTFVHRGTLRVGDLGPLMTRLGMGHHLPSVMQVVGLALGGRFDLPDQAVMVGLRDTEHGPELKLEVLLGMIPDVPPDFLGLLQLGLAERPRELNALSQWLDAFTPDESSGPGRFSILSIRTTPGTPARVNLYLRPIEFELRERIEAAQPEPAYA
ncbi:MAG: hypothetical protein JWM27_1242 [Gemmatimonadetes bacterium]|nr:hypothetical protein [Gemmatimonadota bacterium]